MDDEDSRKISREKDICLINHSYSLHISNPYHQTLVSDVSHQSISSGHGHGISEKENGNSEQDASSTAQPTANSLLDRKNRLIAGMISQFRTLVQLASAPPSDGATREIAAAQGLRLEAETQTLIRTAEDVLTLTRELKEMWLFGALRKLGEGEEEGSMDEDSEKVMGMVQDILKAARERNGAESNVEDTEAKV